MPNTYTSTNWPRSILARTYWHAMQDLRGARKCPDAPSWAYHAGRYVERAEQYRSQADERTRDQMDRIRDAIIDIVDRIRP
jgi:hypothetical protein